MRKKISIIIPVFNEGEGVKLFHDALSKVLAEVSVYESEIIFVNDGSTDETQFLIEDLAAIDARISHIEFTRNFGKEIALTAGLKHSTGDAAIMIDADLQHPPELINKFISLWEQGFEQVIGIRETASGEGLFKKIGSAFFYRIMGLIGETRLIPHSTDFRLVDRAVIDEFNRFTEHNRITRGLLDWLGFRKTYIKFKSVRRSHGQPQYSRLKLIKLALSAFVSHSLFPLKLAGYLGIFIFILSGAAGLVIIIEYFLLNDPLSLNFTGSAMLAVLNTFLIGIVLSCLGLIALYIGNIQEQVTGRPMYVARKRKIKH